MIELSLNSNIDKVAKRIEKIILNFDTIPIHKIAEEVRSSIEINLNAPRSDDGSALKPLSKEYKDWKIKHGYPAEIFQKTGLLARSVKKKRIRKGLYRVFIDPKREKVMSYLHDAGRKAFGYLKALPRIREMYPQILRDLLTK